MERETHKKRTIYSVRAPLNHHFPMDFPDFLPFTYGFFPMSKGFQPAASPGAKAPP
jgi:hypothetical protein